MIVVDADRERIGRLRRPLGCYRRKSTDRNQASHHRQPNFPPQTARCTFQVFHPARVIEVEQAPVDVLAVRRNQPLLAWSTEVGSAHLRGALAKLLCESLADAFAMFN